jgi:hypothetical protein
VSILILALFNASLDESVLKKQYIYSAHSKSWYFPCSSSHAGHILIIFMLFRDCVTGNQLRVRSEKARKLSS